MKILVTGGAGFIGSNLIRYILKNTPHEVLNFDKLTYAGNLSSLADVSQDPRYRFVQGDICDGELVRKTWQKYRPASVMHLAAESHVDRSIDGPGEFIRTNVLGTFTLLEESRRYYGFLKEPERSRFRFLHVSTDEVYGSLTHDAPAFTEDTKYEPHSPYSASKAGSDHLARAWFDTYGLPVLVTNCSNNYGPYQFPEKLIPVVILKALKGDSIPVYGKGENIRDWLYVEDHAAALLTVLEKGRLGETYNIGGNNELRNIDLVRMLCGILDEVSPRGDGLAYAQQIRFVTDRLGHDLRYGINASKMNCELGWNPKHSQETGFRETVSWYLCRCDWWEEILNGKYLLERLGTSSCDRSGSENSL